MKTICDCCIFKLTKGDIGFPFKTPEEADFQGSCYFGRPEKFEKAGIKVNKEKVYWEIEGLCDLCTMQENGDTRTVGEMATLAYDKIRFKCDYIVWPETIDELKQFIRRINDVESVGGMLPNQVIILNSLKMDLLPIVNKVKTKWVIVTEVNSPLTWDDAIDKVKAEYFVLPAGKELDENIVDYCEDIKNNQMTNFLVILGKWGTVVNLKAYKFFCGNFKNFPDKLLNPPKELPFTTKMVYDWEDFKL